MFIAFQFTKFKTTLISSLAFSMIVTSAGSSFAQSQAEPTPDFDLGLFIGAPLFGEEELSDQELADGESEIVDAPSFNDGDGLVKITNTHLKEMTNRIALAFESGFFTDSKQFWPTWDTSKIQVLIVNQADDYALLLNNQNAKVDSLGKRIEYSARTIDDNEVKVNQFGVTEMNGAPTYYFNTGLYFSVGEFGDPESMYESELNTAIHEAVHLTAQANASSVDMVDYAETRRGVSFPIDIETRYLRNQVYYLLQQALDEKDKLKKVDLVRNALYFQKRYYQHKKENKQHDGYDYAEGMADYVTAAVLMSLENPKAEFDAVHAKARQFVTESPTYSKTNSNQSMGVLEWGREYYELGALAYAAAVDLGHLDIMDANYSPLAFLAKKYRAKKGDETTELKTLVYDFYQQKSARYKAQMDEIARVMNDPDSVLIDFTPDDYGTTSMAGDSVLTEYDGEEAAFEIRSQEMKFGDNRIKFTDQHMLSIVPSFDEQQFDAGEDAFGGLSQAELDSMSDEEFEKLAKESGGSLAGDDFGGLSQAELESMTDEEFEKFAKENGGSFDDADLTASFERFIVPVKRRNVEIKGDRLSIQTDKFVIFDAKFTKSGRVYTLVSN